MARERSRTSTSSPAFGDVSVSDLGRSPRCVGRILLYVQFLNLWCWAFFIHLLAICVSSLMRFLFSFSHFSVNSSLIFYFKSYLYVLENFPLSHVSFVSVFCLWLAFHSLHRFHSRWLTVLEVSLPSSSIRPCMVIFSLFACNVSLVFFFMVSRILAYISTIVHYVSASSKSSTWLHSTWVKPLYNLPIVDIVNLITINKHSGM